MAMAASRADDHRNTEYNRQPATRPAMDYLFLSGVLALDFVNTERIKWVRAAIRTLCTNLVERQLLDGEALTTLNTILAMGYPALEAASGQELVAVYRTRQVDEAAVLLPIALSALQLFTQAEKHRLHACKNERCILYFYDTTKSATRQWCSLECMNRARSLEHYQHIKEERIFTQER
jgi:predicted RNA-binding Zn ribbon-like protein